MTTVLSERGMQARVCRGMAVVNASLGLIPVIMLASPAGPRNAAGRVAAILATTCCLLMALGWLRRRWPTRIESASFVVLSALSAAAACLVTTRSDVGLLGLTAFAMLTGYAASLHGLRLVAVVWAATAATLIALGWRLAHVDTALLLRSVIMIAAVNISAAVAGRVAVRLILADAQIEEFEPLTGLLSRKQFYRRAVDLLGADRRDDARYLVVLVANVDGYSLVASIFGESRGVRVLVEVGKALRDAMAAMPRWATSRMPSSSSPTPAPAPMHPRWSNGFARR